MALFKAGDITVTSWYLFLFCYFIFLEGYAVDDMALTLKSAKKLPYIQEWYTFIVTLMFFNFNSILCGFGELLIFLLFKKDEKKYYPKLLDRSTRKVPLAKGKVESKCFLIVLYISLGLVDTISSGMYFYRNFMLPEESPKYIDISVKALLIFFTAVFCLIILHTPFDRHKKVGFGIIAFGIAIASFTSYVYEKRVSFDRTIILTKVVSNLGQGFQEVLEKYLLHYKYQSPYIILLFEGIMDNVIIIFTLAIMLMNNSIKSFPIEWLKDSFPRLIRFPLYCIGYNVIRIMINRNTTPTHRVIGDNFHSLFNHIIKAFTKGIKEGAHFALVLVGYFIAFLGGIIYNEMIVIQAFNLANDTKEQIDQRAIDEFKDYQNILNENTNSSIEINDMSNDSSI